MLGSETVRGDQLLLVGASLLATFFVSFAMFYSKRLDNGVVRLYPRLIALERMLDYYFWRDYLKALGTRERAVVEECESVEATTTAELDREIRSLFPKRFPLRHRYLFRLLVVDVLLILAVWALPHLGFLSSVAFG